MMIRFPMIIRLLLLALALLLLTACETGRQQGGLSGNPCEQMRSDAEIVETLKGQVNELQSLAGPGVPDTAADSSLRADRESLLVQKENLLIMATRTMQQNTMDCRARSRPFDAYRTDPEREQGL